MTRRLTADTTGAAGAGPLPSEGTTPRRSKLTQITQELSPGIKQLTDGIHRKVVAA